MQGIGRTTAIAFDSAMLVAAESRQSEVIMDSVKLCLWLTPLALLWHAQAARGAEPPSVISGVADGNAELRRLAKELETVERKELDLRNKLLEIQDGLAQDLKATTPVAIELSLPRGGDDEPTLGLLELSAFLNDFPLIHLQKPVSVSPVPSYPLFLGPLAPGEYTLDVQAVVGFLNHGWPHALPQGRWELRRRVPVRISPGRNQATQKMSVRILPGSPEPRVELAGFGEESK